MSFVIRWIRPLLTFCPRDEVILQSDFNVITRNAELVSSKSSVRTSLDHKIATAVSQVIEKNIVSSSKSTRICRIEYDDVVVEKLHKN